jgi:hypothetical protein
VLVGNWGFYRARLKPADTEGAIALLVKRHLLFERGVVVAIVPCHLAS